MRFSLRSVEVFSVVLVALMLTAGASGSTVACAGASGPGDYSSLSAAVAAASPSGDTITVSGTCTELVAIQGLNNLNIIGTPGATLAEPGGDNPQGDVLDIANSQNVRIQGLRIQAVAHTPETAIAVVGVTNSSVTFLDSTVEGSTQTDGIDVFPTSNLTILGATVVENNPDGVGVYASGSGSAVNVRRGPGPGCPTIRNNGDGLDADNNASVTVRQCAVISGNANNTGVGAFNGGAVDVRLPQSTPGAIQIVNNTLGLFAAQGGRVTVRGPVLVQGNSLNGVNVRSNAFADIGASGAGPLGPTISQNGGGSFGCCTIAAGVHVGFNSALELTAATIEGNFVPGVVLNDNSSARLLAVQSLQINNNQGGVVVQNSSTALLFFGPVLSGNGTDLSCTSDSRAYGDGSGVGRMNCPSFQAQTSPGLGNKARITP